MASVDAVVSDVFWNYVFPAAVIYVAYFKMKVILPWFQTESPYKRIYAYMLHKATNSFNRILGSRKKTLFSEIITVSNVSEEKSTLLEIGVGSGSNFKYYPDNIHLICLDYNKYFGTYLDKEKERYPNIHSMEFVVGTAENMSEIPDDSVEFVVCTLVLCSVKDLQLCLAEVRRVLKSVSMNMDIEMLIRDVT